MNPALEALASDGFETRLAFAATPEAVISVLAKTPEVRAASEALRAGAFSERSVEAFVWHLTTGFTRGVRFPHEGALAAVALLLESWPAAYAEKLLEDLAGLRIAEMAMSARVARLLLVRRRATLPRNTTKRFDARMRTEAAAGSDRLQIEKPVRIEGSLFGGDVHDAAA